jgi:hypothetical protein
VTPREIGLAALYLLLASGCRTPGAPSGGQASPSSVASAAPTVPLAAASASASAAPLRLGSASTGTKDERERALLALLESGQAAQIEVVATEPGAEIDRSLRQSLLGHVVESGAPLARGNAQVGAATATGGEIANLNRVVAGMRAGFRSCYQRALADAPDYQGKLNIKLTVDAQGGVPAAKVTSPQYNGVVFACVEARAKASQFDPPSGGKPTTVTFSVTLSKP